MKKTNHYNGRDMLETFYDSSAGRGAESRGNKSEAISRLESAIIKSRDAGIEKARLEKLAISVIDAVYSSRNTAGLKLNEKSKDYY